MDDKLWDEASRATPDGSPFLKVTTATDVPAAGAGSPPPRTESQRLRALKLPREAPRVPLLDFTDSNFEELVIESPVPVLIDFWAETCAPCRLMHPIVQRLAEHFGPRLRVGRLNVFENAQTTEALAIKAIPHTMLVRGGDVLLELVGDRSFEDLKARVASFLEDGARD